jgi:hypothetical protein
MATQIAGSMSDDDKNAIENMDMEKMISHVTKNVFKMMNNNDESGSVDLSSLFTTPPPQPIAPKKQTLPKTRDICFDLNVDLDDFYTGKKKKINIKRKRIIEVDGKQKVVEEKKKIIIPIEKGMKDEQQIRFEGEADQIPGYKPGDIIITLIENEHSVFQRDEDNLIMVKNINIFQLYEYSFDITHLDGRVLRVHKNAGDSLHLNDSLRKISSQGMPLYKNEGSFGDLFIRFNLVIPKSLEQPKLQKLKEIFDESSEQLSDDYSIEFTLENVSDTDIEDLGDSDSESFSDDSSDISLSSVSVD